MTGMFDRGFDRYASMLPDEEPKAACIPNMEYVKPEQEPEADKRPQHTVLRILRKA